VVAPDKHPAIGRHPENASLGIFNGLGSKGALLAPWLAGEWVAHLRTGRPIDPAVAVARFKS
jgi:glycine/D-amino acid oxidase-like deaminating enzyme